ncbi:MAG: helix-turn-helix domain-containing protein, partial [Thermoanaerobaculia bacterium]
ANNPRYSLRAFARSLQIDHSTLSQIVRGRRRVTTRAIRSLGVRLRMTPMQVAESCAIENDLALLTVITSCVPARLTLDRDPDRHPDR